MGPKRSMFLHDPKSMKFGMFLLVPTFTCIEVIELEEVGLCLQFNVPISPRQLLSSSRVVQHVLWTHPQPTHAEKSFIFGMANKFLEVVRHPLKTTAISGRVQGIEAQHFFGTCTHT